MFQVTKRAIFVKIRQELPKMTPFSPEMSKKVIPDAATALHQRVITCYHGPTLVKGRDANP